MHDTPDTTPNVTPEEPTESVTTPEEPITVTPVTPEEPEVTPKTKNERIEELLKRFRVALPETFASELERILTEAE